MPICVFELRLVLMYTSLSSLRVSTEPLAAFLAGEKSFDNNLNRFRLADEKLKAEK